MKKKHVLSLLAIFIASFTFAQTGFNYKALITDSGNALANQSVTLRFTVLENGTTAVYQETQTATTDANGIVSANIGEGTVVSGDFNTVNWASRQSLKVEIDSGSGYQDFGTNPLKWVPTAKYASKAGSIDFSNITNVPADLSDGDDDTHLSDAQIAAMGYIKNADDADHDANNELQTISKIGNTVTLSNGGGSFTDANTHLTETQVDNYVANNGFLTGEADGSTTNELQDLTLTGTQLAISNGNHVNFTGWDTNAADDFSGDYTDLANKPDLFLIFGTNDLATSYGDNIRHGGNVFIGSQFSSIGSNKSSLLINRRINDEISHGLVAVVGGSGTQSHYGGYFNLTDAGSGTQYGVKNEIANTGNGTHYGSYSKLYGGGSGEHHGVYNFLFGNGTGIQYGVSNDISNSGDATHYGSYSKLYGGGSGDHYGSYYYLYGTGSGDHYGSYSKLYSSGSGVHYGMYNRLIGVGSGTQFGVRNWISNTGDSPHYGSYSSLSGSGSGIHQGTYNSLSGIGTGDQLGVKNNISNSGDATHYGNYSSLSGSGSGHHYGTYNNLSGTGTGEQYGVQNNIDNSGDANHYGSYSSLSGSGSGIHYGTYNRLYGTGTGGQFGIKNWITSTGDNVHYGIYSELSGSGSGVHYGMYNKLIGVGSGTQFGVRNWISNTGDAPHYGNHSYLNGSGSGNKYGTYAYINPTAGGTHYAIYGSATKTGSYAGFFEGDVQMTQKLKAPDSGDADMKAYIYGNITSAGNKRASGSSDGYNISKTSTGVYEITFDTAMPDTFAYTAIATISYGTGVGFVRTRQFTATKMQIFTYDTSGNPADRYFSFVVYKK